MSRITLVTGGARSGKSLYAEQLAQKSGGEDVLYLATAVIVDDEFARRVEKHRARRSVAWTTEERFKDFGALKDQKTFLGAKAVLLDCLGFALNNALYDSLSDWDNPSEDEVDLAENNLCKEINDLVELCRKENKDLIMVTNEVGDSLVPENRISRAYRDSLGRSNCLAASLSDSVIRMTCGLPLELKEEK
ncbi:MAG: bifunctional adenosylcobinamide kinase/adenosylcobinamide-phosphate guanylyltransferase [Clostridia bacterium]|nr:bifunctional adenosylcobinamide kinase/adenosylcobinamide-phosphate guanylyltransferase [Clostridia bacterium]